MAAAAEAEKLGQTPSALSWIKLVDSRGISVWKYEMSLDRGGVTDPGKFVWSFLIDLLWQLYRAGVAIGVWLIDWVLSFTWLEALTGPAATLSAGLSSVMARLGLMPVLLTVTAVLAVLWMAKGKWALGTYELFVGLLIASVASGVLANPVALVAGDNGLIVQSRDAGLQLASGLTNNGRTDADVTQMRKETTALLLDTFVRMPAQTLNFGSVLDGGKCEATYTKVIKAGPYGSEDSKIRDEVTGCDEDLGEVAANPGSGQAISGVIIAFAALFILGFAALVAGVVFVAALTSLYQSLRALVTLILGVLPGRSRGALWQTAAELTMQTVILTFSVVFLAGFLLVIQSVFLDGKPGDIIETFFFVDVLILAGIVLFWRARAALQRTADRLAQALATRPGGSPTPLPQKRPFDFAGTYYKAKVIGGTVGAAGQAASGAVNTAGTVRDRLYRGIGRPAAFASGGVGAAAGFAARTARKHRRGWGSAATGAARWAPSGSNAAVTTTRRAALTSQLASSQRALPPGSGPQGPAPNSPHQPPSPEDDPQVVDAEVIGGRTSPQPPAPGHGSGS